MIKNTNIKNSIKHVINRFAQPSRLYASNGTTLKQLLHTGDTYQNTPADGDRIQMFFMCDGTETKFELGTEKHTTRGIFDLYVNGILDSSGYDDYAAGSTDSFRDITLTEPIVKGSNMVELRINGKNASSTNYLIYHRGSSLQ